MHVSKVQEYFQHMFLKSQYFIPFTYQADDKAEGVVTVDGRKILKGGSAYPKNDATAIGLVFQDYDVTDGPVAISVIVSGEVMTERLPVPVVAVAQTAMKNIGFNTAI